MDDAQCYESLVDVAGRVAERQLTSVALTEAMLARIATVNPVLNAYLAVTSDSALAQAKSADAEIAAGLRRGPLHGVPIAIKDLFHTQGTPTTFASPAYKDFVADADATIVRRLRVAGAVILGRLHLHEGAFGEHNPALGDCLNPWNKAYWPGGSSSGSGVATAAGLCFASLGTDTGGSIRFPSAACGVTGLKVTWGRTSRAGVLPLSASFDTIGPMARSAADAAVMLEAIAGADPLDPTCLDAPVPAYFAGLTGANGARGFRIGYDEALVESGVDAETIAAIDSALGVFRDLGAMIVPVTVPDRREAISAQLLITDAECAGFHAALYKADKSKFGPQLAGAIERGLAADPIALSSAYIRRDRFKAEMARFFSGVDAVISPIYPVVGIRYDEMAEALSDLHRLLGYTCPFNVSGNPSLTLPCGVARVGMPIGMQLIGPHLSEAALLKAGCAFQSVTDWHLRRPRDF